MYALQKSNVVVGGVANDFIYSNPTVSALARFVSNIASEGPSSSQDVEDAHIEIMESILESFVQDFPVHSGTEELPALETILVTGTTGSLGSLLLATLVSLPSVERVYALNRPRSTDKGDIRKRHFSMFAAQGIDPSVLDSPKVTLLEGDAAIVNFGLPSDILNSIVRDVTSIIHTGTSHAVYSENITNSISIRQLGRSTSNCLSRRSSPRFQVFEGW